MKGVPADTRHPLEGEKKSGDAADATNGPDVPRQRLEPIRAVVVRMPDEVLDFQRQARDERLVVVAEPHVDA
ncbi:MAG TPA: hypothetical protein PLN95_04895, partial [Candidatus Saccharibacteria bacterium]|nr:hypothetical protein [Candidatus Saccharibacteria bacterium]